MNATGQCMCGAVTVQATIPQPPRLNACHCDMCRQHNSAMLLSVETAQDSIQITGPVKVFQSSEWAQRAFCETCGSTLWYGTQHDGSRNLAAGLFPDTGGTVRFEFFCDQALSPVHIHGAEHSLTRQETFAKFAPNDGDTP